MPSGNDHYDGLQSFDDARRTLEKASTHAEVCALNDAVEARFSSDRPQLIMSDADWHEWTRLIEGKILDLRHENGRKCGHSM